MTDLELEDLRQKIQAVCSGYPIWGFTCVVSCENRGVYVISSDIEGCPAEVDTFHISLNESIYSMLTVNKLIRDTLNKYGDTDKKG